MIKLKILVVLIAALILAQPALAGVGTVKLEDQLKTYMNNIALEVKSTDDPEQKRAVLNKTLLKIMDVRSEIRRISSETTGSSTLIGVRY